MWMNANDVKIAIKAATSILNCLKIHINVNAAIANAIGKKTALS